jgi:hypothetical protein
MSIRSRTRVFLRSPLAFGGSLVAGLIALQFGLMARYGALFGRYSREFGSLSPEQFDAMNRSMDRIRFCNQLVSWGALPIATLTLLVLSIRAVNKGRHIAGAISFVCGIVVLMWILLTVAVAGLPHGTMIG